MGCRRERHRSADCHEWRVGNLDQPPGRAIEVEGHEEKERDETGRGDQGHDPPAEERDVQPEQPESRSGSEHLEREHGAGDAVVQRREARRLRVDRGVEAVDVEARARWRRARPRSPARRGPRVGAGARPRRRWCGACRGCPAPPSRSGSPGRCSCAGARATCSGRARRRAAPSGRSCRSRWPR